MRLSPLDIRQQQFTVRMFRGLDPQEVDTFLEEVADEYEALLRDNAALREQLTTHEERERGRADIERTLKDTLVTTQRLAEEMKLQARREAEMVVQDARLQGDKVLEEARAEEARIRTEINGLRRTRRSVLEDLRATLERYERFLADDVKSDGEAGQ